MAGANMIVGVDIINPARESLARAFGMTHFVNPKEVKGDLTAHLVELTGGGADYSFECVGNVDLMRIALKCWSPRMGREHHHRRCGRGAGDQDTAVPTGEPGADVEGHRVRRRARPHRSAGHCRLVHGQEDQHRRSDHACAAVGRHQQGVRPDALGREHPQRRDVLVQPPLRLASYCLDFEQAGLADAVGARHRDCRYGRGLPPRRALRSGRAWRASSHR